MRTVFLTLIILLSSGGLTAQSSKQLAKGPVVPLIDYHQHLFSREKARVVYDRPLTAVSLPADLDELVREREKAWNNKTALAELFVEDVLMLNTQDEDSPTWMRGRGRIAEELARYFAKPYRITPVAFRVDDSTGYIAGYYTRGEGENEKHFGHVFISVRKDVSGKWLIAAETPTFPGPFAIDASNADQLIAQLDDAGIQKAIVLSTAYQWGSPFDSVRPDEYERVKAENDFIAREVGRYPKRLVGFCSFNPLKDYAVRELERCRDELKLKGLKLHFGNSQVDIRKPDHLEKLRAVFKAANRLGMPIVAHLWTGPEYETEGDQHARIFIDKLLPEVPNITVQIAHLAGGGRSTPVALKVFAEAIAKHDPRTKNLFFDVATSVGGQTAAGLHEDAELMRRIGLERILYGTDTAPPNPPARVSWANFRGLMPLTDAEIRIVAGNVAPYMK